MHQLPAHPSIIPLTPLTPTSFYPFGTCLTRRTSHHPTTISPSALTAHSAILANQGTAIKYTHLSSPLNLCSQAPSKAEAAPVVSMFTCGTRDLATECPVNITDDTKMNTATNKTTTTIDQKLFLKVPILERHPYTTQSFIPCDPIPFTYLVIVAPTLPTTPTDPHLGPVPTTQPNVTTTSSSPHPWPLPGPGLPSLMNIRAFLAVPGQAIEYGAGTWHAPMVVLGPPGSTGSFVVSQFANGVPEEDCQEVVLDGVWVDVTGWEGMAKTLRKESVRGV